MIHDKAIDRALEMAAKSMVFVATTDGKGVPHLTAANSIHKPEAGRIAVSDWFCPQTVENAVIGRPVSVVVWDSSHDEGHQIIGYVAALEEGAILDGYLPNEDENVSLPQQEYRLLIDVSKVIAFHKAPHSDLEE